MIQSVNKLKYILLVSKKYIKVAMFPLKQYVSCHK